MEEQRICHLKDYINLLVFVGLSTEIELLRLLEWFGMALVSVNLPARRSKMAPRFIQQMTLQFLSTDIKEYINEVWKPFIKCYDFYLS